MHWAAAAEGMHLTHRSQASFSPLAAWTIVSLFSSAYSSA